MPLFKFTAATWKLRAICGRAVAMMVPSRFSMKNAPAISVVTNSGERDLFISLSYRVLSAHWSVCRPAVTVQVHALADYLKVIARIPHLVELAPRIVKRPMQHHHQLPIKGAKQHPMPAVFTHQR